MLQAILMSEMSSVIEGIPNDMYLDIGTYDGYSRLLECRDENPSIYYFIHCYHRIENLPTRRDWRLNILRVYMLLKFMDLVVEKEERLKISVKAVESKNDINVLKSIPSCAYILHKKLFPALERMISYLEREVKDHAKGDLEDLLQSIKNELSRCRERRVTFNENLL